MTYVFLFGGILLVLLVAVVTAAVRHSDDQDPDEEGAPPEARRDAALEALRELEFDYRTGKVPEEEYRLLRRRYGRLALEAREEVAAGAAGTAGGETDAGGSAPGPPIGRAGAGGELAPPAGPPDGPPAACPSCGATLGSEDRFCSRCGARRT